MKKSIYTIIFALSIAIFTSSVQAAILPPVTTAENKTEAQINEAVNEFNHLSKSEKKERFSSLKTRKLLQITIIATFWTIDSFLA